MRRRAFKIIISAKLLALSFVFAYHAEAYFTALEVEQWQNERGCKVFSQAPFLYSMIEMCIYGLEAIPLNQSTLGSSLYRFSPSMYSDIHTHKWLGARYKYTD